MSTTDHEHLPEEGQGRARSLESSAPDHGEPDLTDLAMGIGNRGMGALLGGTPGGVQRQDEEMEEPVAPSLQRAGEGEHQGLDESVARSIEGRRGAGRALDEGTQADMEGALGSDFSDVRVHTDRTSDDLNRSVSAKAFTSGNDVFFRQGTYDPGSSSGRELLAHELTHVVQQRTGTSGLSGGEISDPNDGAEREAAAVGAQVATTPSEGTATTAGSSAPGIARAELEEEPGAVQAAVAREVEEEELQRANEPMEDEAAQLAVARAPESEMEEEPV